MSKMKSQKRKSCIEVFQSERKEFPQGCCITRIVPAKNVYSRKIKHKQKEWE